MKGIASQTVTGPAALATRVLAPALERVLDRWLARLRAGRLTVRYPSGAVRTHSGADPGPDATLQVDDAYLVLRVLLGGEIGFAEAYMDGDWETPDLGALLTLAALNERALDATLRPSLPSRLAGRAYHALRSNTRAGSRRNIAAHYDLGNAFFAAWLDETMSYSSALFSDFDEPLASAQRRKYLRLAHLLDLRPGQRVLEIGCGWGGFAEIAAGEFGCNLTCLTLSHEQADFARARVAKAGLEGRVDIRLQDYRDVDGTFDRIVSIEMLEAVGEANWPTYFGVLRDRLVPGGLAGLQVITIADDAFPAYRRNIGFIQRYIFPGGMLPSPSALRRAAAEATLDLRDVHWFGASYAETLRRWDRDFRHAWSDIASIGFDERFRRMWHFYLRYCETGFDQGTIDVGQFVLARP